MKYDCFELDFGSYEKYIALLYFKILKDELKLKKRAWISLPKNSENNQKQDLLPKNESID